MQLGNLSISQAVKDIAASRAFYEQFGFTTFMGDASKNWLILKNGDRSRRQPKSYRSARLEA